MSTILVTGATGTLGTPTVAELRAEGHQVRALSRRTGAGLVSGDLVSGRGIREAVAGCDTVVHLATGRHDVDAARRIIDASRAAGVRHFLFMSIVGVDKIPLSYYRRKLAIEELLIGSGLPSTILRATQFHNLVDGMFSAQRFSPVIFAPTFSVQPIAVGEVASRLVELVDADAAGRVPDIGGPESRTARDLALAWKRARGSRRPAWQLRLPGATFTGFAAGYNLVPGAGYGTGTFEEYLAAARPAAEATD